MRTFLLFGFALLGGALALNGANQTAAVDAFIRDAAHDRRLSDECRAAFADLPAYLQTWPLSSDAMRDAFAIGDAARFNERDLDRWAFRAYSCVQAAAEDYSETDDGFPLHFCFGHSEQKEAQTFSICVPSECVQENATVS